MVRLARPVSLIRAATQHAERVYTVAQGAAPAPDIEELSSLAAFHEQRRSRRQQGATYPHRRRAEGFA